jgi:hypothetical protein
LAGAFLRIQGWCAGAFPVRRTEHPLGNRHGGDGRRLRARGCVANGNSLACGSKVEYVATDAERQNITWVRAVDPRTGQANVYTSQPRASTTAPPGEIRTMDCVDCHNRPSHILQSPDQSVDLALADGRSIRLFHLSSSRAWRRLPRLTRTASRRCGESTAPCAATTRRLIRRYTRQAAGDPRPPSPTYRTLTTAISSRR